MKVTIKAVLAALLIQVLAVSSTFGQDFASLVAQATQANQQFVAQTNSALEATDLTTLRNRTTQAVATGEQTEALLRQALAIAPDDASRSRVEGVLQHIVAAVAAGREALAEENFDVAQSRVDAMRGEAVEALAELQPFAQVTPQATPVAPVVTPVAEVPPEQLPRAGEVPLMPIALSGLLTAAIGFALRRWTVTIRRQEG